MRTRGAVERPTSGCLGGCGAGRRLLGQDNRAIAEMFLRGEADLRAFRAAGGTVVRAARILSTLALMSGAGARRAVELLLTDCIEYPKRGRKTVEGPDDDVPGEIERMCAFVALDDPAEPDRDRVPDTSKAQLVIGSMTPVAKEAVSQVIFTDRTFERDRHLTAGLDLLKRIITS